jgi:tRNA threonylcarbamoyladenosine biosynthesis protein TsaE
MHFRRPPANKRTASISRPRRGLSPSTHAWHVSLPSPLQTDRLGRAIGSALRGGECLALYGPLGAGKTALVRGIAAAVSVSSGGVSSPTFTLLHEYKGRLPLVHIDLYRLNSLREVESIGLEDYFSGSTVVAIEWADKAWEILPQDRLEMELRHRTVQGRSIKFTANGPLSAALLARIKRSGPFHPKPSRSGRLQAPRPKGTSSL